MLSFETSPIIEVFSYTLLELYFCVIYAEKEKALRHRHTHRHPNTTYL